MKRGAVVRDCTPGTVCRQIRYPTEPTTATRRTTTRSTQAFARDRVGTKRMIPCRPVTNLGGDRAMSPFLVVTSVALFVLAGLCEIGGGYLVWLWLREGRSALLGVLGAVILVAYGVVPTLQAAPFGRVYAAYGGVFIVLSLVWGWALAGDAPDRFDLIGALVCLVGVALIMYAPRG